MATIVGAVTQLRILGAVIGLAVGTTTLSNYITRWLLNSVITLEQLYLLLLDSDYLSNLTDFTLAQQGVVRSLYNAAYNLQFKVMMGFAILSFLISVCAFRNVPIPLGPQEWVEVKG
jgi:hypothetical protein